MADDFEIDISPDMQLYGVLRSQSYGEGAALSEFVDNSIQSFLECKEKITQMDGENPSLLITISIDTQAKIITIEDNAAGIARERLQQAMKMGLIEGKPHPKSSLSVYGMGLKSAAVWFSEKWQLESSYIGENGKISFSFDLNELLAEGKEHVVVTASEEDADKHYTKITIHGHDRDDSQEYYEDIVLPFLLETFFKFREHTEIDVILDGQPLNPNPQKIFDEAKPALCNQVRDKDGKIENKKSQPIKWEKYIKLGKEYKNAHGFIRLMEKGSYGQPGIRLLRNGRVIQGTKTEPNYPPSITGTKNKYGAQRIYGEIHLDNFSVNYQKTGFNEKLSDVYEAIRKELKKTPDLMRQAENFRARKQGGGKASNAKNPSTPPSSKTANAQSSKTATSGKASVANQNQSEYIKRSDQIADLLGQLKYSKLQFLYESLCEISLFDHPILMYVGAWSFLESLSTSMQEKEDKEKKKDKDKEKEKKKEKDSFPSYFGRKVKEWYKERKRKDINDAITEINKIGNANKHSSTSQAMSAHPLYNNFEVLDDFIIECLEYLLDEQPKA